MTTGYSFALHCTRLYLLNSKKRLEYVAGEKYEAADRRGERGYRRSHHAYVHRLLSVQVRYYRRRQRRDADEQHVTLAINESLCLKNADAQISMIFISNE